MKNLRSITLAVFAVAMANPLVSEVSAAPVTTSFDTTVQFTSGIAGVNVGDSFSGSFTYDNDQGAATLVSDIGCEFGVECTDPIATIYRFSDPAYTANISTPSLNYSSEEVSVNVLNDFTIPSALFAEEFTFGMLSNPGVYDFISIGGSFGSLGSLVDLSGEPLNIPEIRFGVMFIGNENMFSDTSLPVSIDDLLNDPNFIGASLGLSQYVLEAVESSCTDESSSCLGGPIPVQTGYIYGEEVSAVPIPGSLLLFISGFLTLVKLSRKKN